MLNLDYYEVANNKLNYFLGHYNSQVWFGYSKPAIEERGRAILFDQMRVMVISRIIEQL
jgi:hypothetical protein